MNEKISQKVRAKVLWDAGHRTPASMKRRGNIPERSAKRYIADFKEGGSHERKAYTPRKKEKKNSRLVEKMIKKAKERGKVYSSRDIAALVNTSHTHVCTVLKENGLRYTGFRKKIKLSEDAKEVRVEFAEEMRERESDWDEMFITDECSFWISKCKPYKVWTSDPLAEEGGGVHGDKIHCWGGISARGALKLEIFEENMDADDYLKILRKKLPEMDRLYPDGYIWQQDGSGVHRAYIVQDFIEDEMPQTIDWPPYSPDLSPIENIWGWLKHQVAKDGPKTVAAMKRAIKKHWARIDVEFLRPYFESMPRRMDMIIEKEGEKIKY